MLAQEPENGFSITAALLTYPLGERLGYRYPNVHVILFSNLTRNYKINNNSNAFNYRYSESSNGLEATPCLRNFGFFRRSFPCIQVISNILLISFQNFQQNMIKQFLYFISAKMWCYCRMVYMPMSYLYGKRFVGPITPLIQELREELFAEPYEKVNWRKVRHLCAQVIN